VIPHARPQVEKDAVDAVVAALEAQRFSQGEEVAALESELSTMFEGADAVVVSSGTAALYTALVALGAGPGRQVIIPSYTCNSLYAATVHAGASAVSADLEEHCVSLTPSTVEPLASGRTAAVVAPHTCGYVADIDGIRGLGFPVIEDCAQAVGGRYPDGSPLGSKGDVAVLSFFATKLLPGGEGGACITRDRDVSQTVRRLRDCDERPPDPAAFNFKMPDINAAIVRTMLAALPANVNRRKRLAQQYSFRSCCPQKQPVCFRYLVCVGGTAGPVDSFMGEAGRAGVCCRRPIWQPIHRTIGGNCPVTDRMHETLVSVPLYPDLTKTEIKLILGKLPQLLA
jgi:perosamine synthetase